MRAVGVRELKNRLSEYLRLVAEGEVVLITHHNHIVASLGPPPASPVGAPEAAELALERLARSGLVRMGSGELPSVSEPPLRTPAGPIDLPGALEALRAERFGE